MKKTSTSDQNLELECSTIDFVKFRKIKKAKQYIKKLNEVRSALDRAANCLKYYCDKESDVLKLYNEIIINYNVYTSLIKTYENHIQRLERQDGI